MSTSAGKPDSDGFRIYTPESIGAALRHFREEVGLTQAELAEQVGIHRSYLSDLERGKKTEQVRRIIVLFRHLGVRMTIVKADW